MRKLINRKTKKLIFIFLILFLMGDLIGLLAHTVSVKAATKKSEKKVLLFYSYNGEEKFENDFVIGIKRVINKKNIVTKYLDSRGYDDDEYLEYFAKEIKLLREREEFDGIITMGEQAKKFADLYGRELFQDKPIINIGVNYGKEEIDGENYVTSVDLKINELIEEIFNIHMDIDNLLIVEDQNPGYDWKIESYIGLSDVDESKIKRVKVKSPDELVSAIEGLKGKTVVLFSPISTFDYDSYKLYPRLLETKKNVPIYSFWGPGYGYNTIGGLFYYSYLEGELAAKKLKLIMDGETQESKVIKSDNLSKWQFNYNFVKKYNVHSGKMTESNLRGVPKKKNPLIWIVTTIASVIIFVLLNFLYFNIIKRRAAEESYEKNREELTQVKETSKVKTDFFANITHDIRTPIGVIQSITQLLKVFDHNNVESRAKIDSYYQTINDNCNRLLRMTSNLIDMTKIEAGFMELEKKNFEMVGLVENLVLSISELCNEKEIDVIFDTEVEEVVMMCDGYKIERVIMNLLSNAIKFTPAKGEIEVYMLRKNSELKISVKDSGIGMPECKLKSIFNKFDMGDGNQEINSFGCGIGLYIVKSIVEKHHGDIQVTSTVGVGTEFLITIPIVDSHEGEIIYTYLSDSYDNKIDIEFS